MAKAGASKKTKASKTDAKKTKSGAAKKQRGKAAYRLACADFTFPLLEHDKVLALIALLGLEGADIGLFEGRSHLQPSKELKKPDQAGAALAKRLRGHGLRCADVFLQMDNDFTKFAVNHPQASRRKKARDWFLKTLDYAAAAGSAHVTTLPGVYFKEEKKSASWKRACDELAWRLEKAAERKLAFSIEGHVGSLAPKPKPLKRLVDEVPGLTLTLDYTHFTRIGLPDGDVEPLVPHASHFHVRGARKGRLQAPFKDNVIDYARVVKLLQKAGYAGWLGIEYTWFDWEHCNETDNVSETILYRDFLKKTMGK